MALIAFIAGGIAGLASAVAASVFLGFGFLAAFGLYLGVATLLPLALLMVALRDDGAHDGRMMPASA